MPEYPEIDCLPPALSEPGDVWFCPKCARKFYRVMITVEDKGLEAEAWYTDELG